MRDLKFRYYSHKSKEMRSWDDLQKLHVHTVFKMMQTECKLMQFTGLKDKNGVEIYDGDVLNKNSHNWVVVDCFESGSVKMNRVGGKGASSNPRLTRWQAETSVVVGNIYENPELLKTPD